MFHDDAGVVRYWGVDGLVMWRVGPGLPGTRLLPGGWFPRSWLWADGVVLVSLARVRRGAG